MQGLARTSVAAGALILIFAAPAFGQDFLPEEAWYDGKTNHGGQIDFKVKNNRVKRIKGELPLPKGEKCKYGDERRIPINIPQNDPIQNGPFSIDATQRVNPGTSRWRRLRLIMRGQFSSDAERASGTIFARVRDSAGKCEVRDDLTWHMSRRR